MKLTDKVIQCQKLGANKDLTFGCLIYRELSEAVYQLIDHSQEGNNLVYFGERQSGSFLLNEIIILGSPITYGRLIYLHRNKRGKSKRYINSFYSIDTYFYENNIYIDKTILERPDELVDLVLYFLQLLQGKKSTESVEAKQNNDIRIA